MLFYDNIKFDKNIVNNERGHEINTNEMRCTSLKKNSEI